MAVTSRTQWFHRHIPGIKIDPRFFQSCEYIDETVDGPYRGFGYLSLFSDSEGLANMEPCNFASFNLVVDAETSII